MTQSFEHVSGPGSEDSGVLSVYGESLFWDLNEERVRLTITRKEKTLGAGHPLDFAKFARLFAERWEEMYRQAPEAYGPYTD